MFICINSSKIILSVYQIKCLKTTIETYIQDCCYLIEIVDLNNKKVTHLVLYTLKTKNYTLKLKHRK